MSFFEYYCECGNYYEETRPIGTPHPKKCPSCGLKYGEGFYQNYGDVTLGKGVIPVTTAGQYSDLNKKRVGKYKLEEMELDARKYSQIGRPDEKYIEKLKKDIANGVED